MTTDRTEEGVRVRVKIGDGRRTGTALYGPYGSSGRTMPGFDFGQWRVPVRMDHNGEVWEYATTDLEPGPPRRPVPALGSRQVKHRERQETGTLLESLVFGGITWPGLDRAGNLMVPVRLDDGRHRIWRATDIEHAPDPEPSLAQAPVGPQGGPRVRVRDRARGRDRGRVLYRAMASGRVWPDFDRGEWRVPVLMEATGTTLFVLAKDLKPFTEPERGPVARALFDQAETEATILAEADRVASAIQAKALRDVAGAVADALELFASRLRDIELNGDGA